MTKYYFPTLHCRNHWAYSLVLFLLIAVSCSPTDETEEGISMPDQATLFGEEIISTPLPEFASSFSPDGNTVYFNRTSADRDSLQIFSSRMENGAWSVPEPLWFSDGTYFDVDPFVSHDGSRLYFSSNRPLEGDSAKDFDTWYVEREAGAWGAPINVGAPLNGPDSEVFVSLTEDRTMYFSISRDGIRAIYRSEFTEAGYLEPEKIKMPVSDSVGIGNPLIHPEERFLLFTSRDLHGFGGVDIYMADHLGDGTFGNVRNAGPAVNSPYADFAPGISADRQSLFFASERPGVVGEVAEGVRPPGDLYEVSMDVLLNSVTDIQAILGASRQAILGDEMSSIESISIVADCEGPTGPFETRITSVPDGRMFFEQVIDSSSWQAGISEQGPWSRTDEGIEPADSLTQTFLQGHELHMLAIAPESRYQEGEYAGIQEFEGDLAHALIFKDVLGGDVVMYYSMQNSLPRGMKNINHMGRGARDIYVLFEDWEAVDSIQLFRKATFKHGDDVFVYDYRSIELNVPVDGL